MEDILILLIIGIILCIASNKGDFRTRHEVMDEQTMVIKKTNETLKEIQRQMEMNHEKKDILPS